MKQSLNREKNRLTREAQVLRSWASLASDIVKNDGAAT